MRSRQRTPKGVTSPGRKLARCPQSFKGVRTLEENERLVWQMRKAGRKVNGYACAWCGGFHITHSRKPVTRTARSKRWSAWV